MPEGQIAYDRDSMGGEKIEQESVQLGLATTVFELPDEYTSDFFQSTGQP